MNHCIKLDFVEGSEEISTTEKCISQAHQTVKKRLKRANSRIPMQSQYIAHGMVITIHKNSTLAYREAIRLWDQRNSNPKENRKLLGFLIDMLRWVENVPQSHSPLFYNTTSWFFSLNSSQYLDNAICYSLKASSLMVTKNQQAIILNGRGLLFHFRDDFGSAISCYHAAIELRVQLFGSNDVALWRLHYYLGQNYYNLASSYLQLFYQSGAIHDLRHALLSIAASVTHYKEYLIWERNGKVNSDFYCAIDSVIECLFLYISRIDIRQLPELGQAREILDFVMRMHETEHAHRVFWINILSQLVDRYEAESFITMIEQA